MALAKLTSGLLALVIVAASCSNTDSGSGAVPTSTPQPTTTGTTLRIENRGDNTEGHTPQGFAGMGTGLFAGDNLNPGFPNGDGVQLFVTFDLPAKIDIPSSVLLTSDALNVSGTPFEDLGELRAAPVSYPSFGREIFDRIPNGDAVLCKRSTDTAISCDVTQSVAADVAAGATRVQFRVRFDTPGDGDQSQDLAMFFLTDSNTNEPGIFILELTS